MAGMNDQPSISTTASRFANAPGAMVDDELDLSRLWRVLIDGGWWIIVTTGLFALVGVAYALVATPIYQADSLVQVEGKKEATRDFFDRADRYEGENAAKGLAEIEIVRSRLVVGRVVNDLKLDIVVKPKHGFMSIFSMGDNTVHGDGSDKRDFIFAGWRDGEQRIQVDSFKAPDELTDKKFILQLIGLNQFELQFDGETVLQGGANQDLVSADGEIALRLSELQAPEGRSFTLTRLHKLTAVKAIAENLAVTEQGKGSGILKLTLTDSQPRRAAQILNAVTESYLLQNVQRQAVEAEKSLDFLNEKLPEIRVALDNAEQELSGYRTKAESVDLSQEAKAILDQQINLETRINELNVKESELRPLFTREHPNYRSLMEQRGNLESERKRLDRMTQRLPETEQKVLRLTRDVEVYKELYVQLVNRSEELKVVKAGSVGNVRILDRAEVQPKPVAPRKTFIVILATLLGGMVGVGSVLMRDGFSGQLESPELLEQSGLTVYANLPLSEKEQKQGHAGKRTSDWRKSPGSNNRSGSPPLLANLHPGDATVEALRGLRTSLLVALTGAKNNVLMISGPSTEVGKSFVTANLGVLLAQAGRKVLLIDGDMRKGHLHNYFDGREGKGLAHYLSSKAELSEIVHKTSVEGVELIPRGAIPNNPAELLMHPRMNELLNHAAENYDVVLIDTPPVLAVTDAAIIGKLAGISLLVVRAGVNSIEEVALTCRRFEQNGVGVQGCVFNGMKPGFDSIYGIGAGYYG